MHGKLLERTLEPGSLEWLRAGVSASRIPIIMGTVPPSWGSKWELWHRYAGNLPVSTPATDAQARGHFLEPAIADWWGAQHPLVRVEHTGTWVHPEDSRFLASPDRLLAYTSGDVEVLEIKTAARPDDWADGPPPYYVDQTQWQMGVLGVPRARVAVLTAYLEFDSLTVEFDPQRWSEMAHGATEFLDSLPDGKSPKMPPIDGSEATWAAVKKMHPKITDGDVEIPAELAASWYEARDMADYWDERKRRFAGEVVDRLGPFRNAVTPDGHKVGRRQGVRGGGTTLVATAGKSLSSKPAVQSGSVK